MFVLPPLFSKISSIKLCPIVLLMKFIFLLNFMSYLKNKHGDPLFFITFFKFSYIRLQHIQLLATCHLFLMVSTSFCVKKMGEKFLFLTLKGLILIQNEKIHQESVINIFVQPLVTYLAV